MELEANLHLLNRIGAGCPPGAAQDVVISGLRALIEEQFGRCPRWRCSNPGCGDHGIGLPILACEVIPQHRRDCVCSRPGRGLFRRRLAQGRPGSTATEIISLRKVETGLSDLAFGTVQQHGSHVDAASA